MYYVTCDGYPLLDWRDNDLILVNPKVKLEVNTVGEGSFTIYKNHPYYDKLKKLKSVFEVSDENSVIFRGRATGDTIDFDHGTAVDLEGAMAFFNDSVVRPYSFPKDFTENAEYNTAAASGNVIAFFLKWLIDNHNSQVQDFQKMKLGNVTVTDPNNYITRSNSNYSSTWETLKAKLFDSSLGGYLCIRYEADGNYIDYLSDFTETNSQRVEYGENLLDLTNETEASETYSAIIPIGAAGLTIDGLDDGDITDDLVKEGDTIYSKSTVAEYGWIYAPTSETTWDDVTDDRNLRTKGAEWLANGGSSVLKAIEATAVDLHFTTEQAESLRIYKNVEVYSAPHNVSETFPLSKLEIDLLNPQNTKVKVGKTLPSLTERTAIQDDEVLTLYSKITKTDEEIRIFVADELKGVENSIQTHIKGITLDVSGEDGSTTFSLTYNGASISTDTFDLSVKAVNITGQLTANQINATDLHVSAANVDGTLTASQINATDLKVSAANITGKLTAEQIETKDLKVDAANITGTLTIGALPEMVAKKSDIPTVPTNISAFTNDSGFLTKSTMPSIPSKLADLEQYEEDVTTIIGGVVDTDYLYALGVSATYIRGETIDLADDDDRTIGTLKLYKSDDEYFVELSSGSHLTLEAPVDTTIWGGTACITLEEGAIWVNHSILPDSTYSLGADSYPWDTLYADSCTCCTSDENKKNSIENLPDKYLVMFDNLHPKRFKLNNGTSGRYHPGYTAQDVKAAMDIAGIDSMEFGGWIKYTDDEGNEGYMLRYEEFGAIYAAKIKQLEARVAKLEVAQNG